MRSDFEQWFPTTHPLRELAADIASLGLGTATGSGVWTAKPPPWNLVCNGEAAGWTPSKRVRLASWIARKRSLPSQHGFSGHRWGLSLLFDPFVDATLWAYGGGYGAGSTPRAFSGTRVLVLTDYSPIKDVLSDAMRISPVDYGEGGVLELLRAEKTLQTTGYNIVKWVTQQKTIKSVRRALKQDSDYLLKQFALHRILIWNFFPFQRGGVHCMGTKGLPLMQNSQWLDLCCDYLERFLQAVSATQVIWAVNQSIPQCPLAGLNRKFLPGSHPYNWSQAGPAPTL
jgi:hypothetical protein